MFAFAQAAVSPHSPTLDRVATLAARLLDLPYVGVFIGDRPRLQLRAQSDVDSDSGSTFDEIRAIAAWAPVTPTTPVVYADLREDEYLSRFAPSIRSCVAIAIPLWDGSTTGLLIAAGTSVLAATPGQVRSFGDLAALAGNEIELERRRGNPHTAPERRRTQEQLLEKTLEVAKFGEDLRQLHRLSTTDYESLDELFQDYLETGRSILALSCGVVAQVRGRYAVIRACRSDSFPLRPGMTFELSQVYCGAVFEAGKTIGRHYVGQEPSMASRPHYGPIRQSAYVGAPIIVDGDTYGILSFSSPHPRWREFSSHEVELIELMAKSIGRSILEGRMQSARTKAEELERDRSLVLEMVAKDRPISEVLHQIASMVERQSPSIAVTLHAVRDGMLHCLAAPGMPDVYLRKMQSIAMKPGPGNCYSAAFSCQTDLFTTGPQCRFDESHEFCWQACATTPVLSGTGEVLGLLMAYWKLAVQPRSVDAELLEMASALAAIAMEHRRLTDRLDHQAHHDALTGLPNRALFTRTLDDLVAVAQSEASLLAIVFLDLDRFKQINDHLGHGAGDLVLCETASRLCQALRPTEMAARFGGDEFVVVLTAVDSEEHALKRSEEILSAIRTPIPYDGTLIEVTASAGLSMYPRNGTDGESILGGADAAMYRVKNTSRNGVQCFALEHGEERSARLKLEHELRHAIARGELQLSFQPIWDIRHNEGISLDSFEVLLVWDHPQLGRVSPTQFIPVAEEAGLIAEIGSWVLQKACEAAASWAHKGLGEYRISVNVSAIQFALADFADIVVLALHSSGLHPSQLELELTESVIMECFETAAAKMERLRALGVRIALDDFGTGYSSLGYLRSIPVDTLKIDQSFVSETGESASALTLVQTIVSMAHNMHLAVVAEGVETETQLELLRGIDCDRAQGHLFGRALPESDLELYLTNAPLLLR